MKRRLFCGLTAVCVAVMAGEKAETISATPTRYETTVTLATPGQAKMMLEMAYDLNPILGENADKGAVFVHAPKITEILTDCGYSAPPPRHNDYVLELNAKKGAMTGFGAFPGGEAFKSPVNVAKIQSRFILPAATHTIERLSGTVEVESAGNVRNVEIPLAVEGGQWKSGIFKFVISNVKENDPAVDKRGFSMFMWPKLKGKWTEFVMRRCYKNGRNHDRNSQLSMLNRFLIRSKTGHLIPVKLLPGGSVTLGDEKGYGFIDNTFGFPLPLSEVDVLVVEIPENFKSVAVPFTAGPINLQLLHAKPGNAPAPLPAVRVQDVELNVGATEVKTTCRIPNKGAITNGKGVRYDITREVAVDLFWSIPPGRPYSTWDVRLKPRLELIGSPISARRMTEAFDDGVGHARVQVVNPDMNTPLALSGGMWFYEHMADPPKVEGTLSVFEAMRIKRERMRLFNSRRRSSRGRQEVPFEIKGIPLPKVPIIDPKLATALKALNVTLATGNSAGAIEEAKAVEALAGKDPWAWATLANYYGRLNEGLHQFRALEQAVAVDGGGELPATCRQLLYKHYLNNKAWRSAWRVLISASTTDMQLVEQFSHTRKKLVHPLPVKPVVANHLYAVPVATQVTVDGKPDEWDLTGPAFACLNTTLEKDLRNVKISMAYDAKNLYVFARRRQLIPMNNWNKHGKPYDYLSLRINRGPGDGRLVKHYFSSRMNRAVAESLDLADSEYVAPVNKEIYSGIGETLGNGHAAAYVLHKDGKGYDVEIKVPLAELLSKTTLVAKDTVNVLVAAGFAKEDILFINPAVAPKASDYGDWHSPLAGWVTLLEK